MDRWKLTTKAHPFVRPDTRIQSIGVSTNVPQTVVPPPYPTTLLPGQEAVEAYWVVDRGREVGIFADKYVRHLHT